MSLMSVLMYNYRIVGNFRGCKYPLQRQEIQFVGFYFRFSLTSKPRPEIIKYFSVSTWCVTDTHTHYHAFIGKYRIAGIFRRSLISFFSFSFFLNEFIQNENLT